MLVQDLLEAYGGVASRRQLVAAGCDGMWIDMAAQYRRIHRVRAGWYVLPGTAPAIVRAVRIGGLLACISALELRAGLQPNEPLHVLVLRGSSRLRLSGPSVVLHWTRRDVGGYGGAVGATVARGQAFGCRWLEESDKAHIERINPG